MLHNKAVLFTTLSFVFLLSAAPASATVVGPYRLNLSLSDVRALSDAVLDVDPEAFEVINVSLSQGRTAICASDVYTSRSGRYQGAEIACRIGNNPPLYDRILHPLNSWLRQTTGSLVPNTLVSDDSGYEYVCRTNGAVNPQGDCELAHLFANPRAAVIPALNSPEFRAAMNRALPHLQAYVPNTNGTICVQAERANALSDALVALRGVVRDQDVRLQDVCENTRGPVGRAFRMSIVGNGFAVNPADLDRVNGLIQDTLPMLERYLVTGHGTEGGNAFCLAFKSDVTESQFNDVMARFSNMPVDRNVTESRVSAATECQLDEEGNPSTIVSRDADRERAAAPGAAERAQARAAARARVEAGTRVQMDAVRLVFARALALLPAPVVSGRPYVTIPASGNGPVMMSANYKLANGDYCALAKTYAIRLNDAGRPSVQDPVELFCFTAQGNNIKKVDVRDGIDVVSPQRSSLEVAWVNVFLYLLDQVGPVSEVHSNSFTANSYGAGVVGGYFNATLRNGETCITESYSLKQVTNDTFTIEGPLVEIRCFAPGLPARGLATRTIPLNQSLFPIRLQ